MSAMPPSRMLCRISGQIFLCQVSYSAMRAGSGFISSARQYLMGRPWFYFMSFYSKVQDDGETDQRHDIRHLDAMRSVGDKPHHQGGKGSANDRHDEERRSQLGFFAKVLDAEGKDRREHDRHEKRCSRNSVYGDMSLRGQGDEKQADIDCGINAQQPCR